MLHELRNPELLAMLERLQLGTRRHLAGQLVGAHRSPRYGSSLDFADFREYQPGDDFRRIDYLTLARLDQLLIRLYDAEDDLTVKLLIDSSASMLTDNKFQRALELAGALGFVALTRRDRVQVHSQGRPMARFSGRHGIPQLFAHLEGLSASGVGSLTSTAATTVNRSRGPGMTVLCSDLLEDDWASAFRTLGARGAELTVVHVLGEGELAPLVMGDVDLVDSETNERIALSLVEPTLQRYQARLDSWMDDVTSQARRVGASYLLADTRVPLREALLSGLRQAEVVS